MFTRGEERPGTNSTQVPISKEVCKNRPEHPHAGTRNFGGVVPPSADRFPRNRGLGGEFRDFIHTLSVALKFPSGRVIVLRREMNGMPEYGFCHSGIGCVLKCRRGQMVHFSGGSRIDTRSYGIEEEG